MEGNPINYFDPSGHIAEGHEARTADVIRDKLKILYGVEIKKDWGYILYYAPHVSVAPSCVWNKGNWRSVDELSYVLKSVKNTADIMGGPVKFKIAMNNHPVHVTRYNITSEDLTYYALPFADIVLTNYGFTNENFVTYTLSHELGHIWDIRNGFRLSSEMSKVVGTYYCDPSAGWPCFYDVHKGQEPPPGDPNLYENYAGTNAREDWAEAFANYIYPNYYKNFKGYKLIGPIRRQYVQDQIQSNR